MDESTQDAIGKALYDACATVLDDGIEWQDVLAKHVYIRRAQAVVDAWVECTQCEKCISQAKDNFHIVKEY